MLHWFISFLEEGVTNYADIGFVLTVCDLIVSTFFDIAFHGMLRIRLSSNRRDIANSARDLTDMSRK